MRGNGGMKTSKNRNNEEELNSHHSVFDPWGGASSFSTSGAPYLPFCLDDINIKTLSYKAKPRLTQ